MSNVSTCQKGTISDKQPLSIVIFCDFNLFHSPLVDLQLIKEEVVGCVDRVLGLEGKLNKFT